MSVFPIPKYFVQLKNCKMFTTIFLAGMFLAFVNFSAHAQVWPEPLSQPLRIAESPHGLLVGEYQGHSVAVVDLDTQAVQSSIPITQQPLSQTWMNGRVYVATDYATFEVFEGVSVKKNLKNPKNPKKIVNWVRIFPDETGSITWGPTDIEFTPSDMEADEDLGLIFIADKWGKTILVLDASGAIDHTITGLPGRPHGIALDRVRQRIFVTVDIVGSFSSYSSVQIYDYNGVLLASINGRSVQPPGFEFSRAQGLTVDNEGRLYMVDVLRGQVMVFEENSPNVWTGLGTFGRRGSGIKELLMPMDVVVDEVTSTVYVTNFMKARLEVFTMGDMVQ